MNLCALARSRGQGDPQRPALGIGARVLRTYGETAGRVARLAGALRGFGLKPGDRVAIVAKNSPDYVEVLYAIWHAGLAAVPANAKLHGAELGYILEQSGARVCFASDGLDGEIAPHAPKSLERLIVIGGAEYEKLFAADPDRRRSARRRRSRLAVLHLRHHRPAEGRDADPPRAGGRERGLSAAEVDAAVARRSDPARGADEPRLRASTSWPHVMRRGVNVVPESGGFEPEEIFGLFRAWPRTSMFAAPTMVKRLVESPAECPSENIRTII